MKKLFLIPARGGSKGLPRKNVLLLAGRPMIYYTLDAARGAMENEDELCVSTDDIDIIKVVENYGVEVPFIRPIELASDYAGTNEVVQHALDWYAENMGINFDIVVLLQVTSPLRNSSHILNALKLWNEDLDLIISVKETETNPYYTLYEEDCLGNLRQSKAGTFKRRQDCPIVYEVNGAVYIYKVKSLGKEHLEIKKYVMDKKSSIDIDDYMDFKLAELFIHE